MGGDVVGEAGFVRDTGVVGGTNLVAGTCLTADNANLRIGGHRPAQGGVV